MGLFERENIMKLSKKNPLCSEHLKKGEKCIIACFGTFRDFEKTDPESCKILLSPSSDETSAIEVIDYDAKPSDGKNISAKTAGYQTYVISLISGRDKITRYLYDCTSVFAVGREKKTGKNISFLSHQDPKKFLKERYQKQFTKDLSESLEELKNRCVKRTVDIVISGGQYPWKHSGAEWSWAEAEIFRALYRQSISLLSDIVMEVFGFEPVVISGPKKVERSDAIMCINKTRRMHIVKPQVGESMTESFLPRNFGTQEEKWQQTRPA